MSKDISYTQVRLYKDRGSYIIWIPSKFAKKGKYLNIHKNNTWDNGWLIEETYNTKSFSQISEKERDYLKQREYSDV